MAKIISLADMPQTDRKKWSNLLKQHLPKEKVAQMKKDLDSGVEESNITFDAEKIPKDVRSQIKTQLEKEETHAAGKPYGAVETSENVLRGAAAGLYHGTAGLYNLPSNIMSHVPGIGKYYQGLGAPEELSQKFGAPEYPEATSAQAGRFAGEVIPWVATEGGLGTLQKGLEASKGGTLISRGLLKTPLRRAVTAGGIYGGATGGVPGAAAGMGAALIPHGIGKGYKAIGAPGAHLAASTLSKVGSFMQKNLGGHDLDEAAKAMIDNYTRTKNALHSGYGKLSETLKNEEYQIPLESKGHEKTLGDAIDRIKESKIPSSDLISGKALKFLNLEKTGRQVGEEPNIIIAKSLKDARAMAKEPKMKAKYSKPITMSDHIDNRRAINELTAYHHDSGVPSGDRVYKALLDAKKSTDDLLEHNVKIHPELDVHHKTLKQLNERWGEMEDLFHKAPSGRPSIMSKYSEYSDMPPDTERLLDYFDLSNPSNSKIGLKTINHFRRIMAKGEAAKHIDPDMILKRKLFGKAIKVGESQRPDFSDILKAKDIFNRLSKEVQNSNLFDDEERGIFRRITDLHIKYKPHANAIKEALTKGIVPSLGGASLGAAHGRAGALAGGLLGEVSKRALKPILEHMEDKGLSKYIITGQKKNILPMLSEKSAARLLKYLPPSAYAGLLQTFGDNNG